MTATRRATARSVATGQTTGTVAVPLALHVSARIAERDAEDFLYDPTHGTYTTLDDPAATTGTAAYGINVAGQIVGYYNNSTGTHGFFYNPSGGTYTTLDDPLATSGTFAYGINDAGQIVGTYFTNTGILSRTQRRRSRQSGVLAGRADDWDEMAAVGEDC